MRQTAPAWIFPALLGTLLAGPALAAAAAPVSLQQAVAGTQRSAAFVARDQSRHPVAELSFFGLTPTQHVVEIWPAPGYWTEILAPVLHDHGSYIVAVPPPRPGMAAGGPDPFAQKLAATPALYDHVVVTRAGPGHFEIAPPGSADLVLTFRNLHNWMKAGIAPQMIDAFHLALKPGGVLGIEEHRAHGDAPQDPHAANGYVRQDYATALIEHAGFRLIGSSEVNANPKDTANWPAGVWTLPPTLVLGAKDRDRYLAVGEGDNFVLKFRKI